MAVPKNININNFTNLEIKSEYGYGIVSNGNCGWLGGILNPPSEINIIADKNNESVIFIQGGYNGNNEYPEGKAGISTQSKSKTLVQGNIITINGIGGGIFSINKGTTTVNGDTVSINASLDKKYKEKYTLANLQNYG